MLYHKYTKSHAHSQASLYILHKIHIFFTLPHCPFLHIARCRRRIFRIPSNMRQIIVYFAKRYKLLTSDTRKSLIDALSLNMCAGRNMGYAFGKTGIALTLLNVAHKFGRQYEYLEDHAVSLLEETLAVNIEQPTFT